MFGFGAGWIAILDAATASPFTQLSAIPILTLIAFYAPAGHRATWFALMASLVNLATVAGQLQTKYLNHLFVIERGQYGELGALLIVATTIGFVVPIFANPCARSPDLTRASFKKNLCSQLTSISVATHANPQ